MTYTEGIERFDVFTISTLETYLPIFISVEFIDQKLKVDDPVGAISVHGVNGAFGQVLGIKLFGG